MHTNSQIKAGNQLHIQSGGDTHLIGAVAQGKQVTADIGGNLTIQSLQDTSRYDSKNQSASGSGTFGAGGASVNQQSCIQAGIAGYGSNGDKQASHNLPFHASTVIIS